MRRVRRRDEVARLEAELGEARPYLDLAREIHAEIERIARDPGADTDALVDAVGAIPARERRAVALTVFQQLPQERQWEILERVVPDTELRDALETVRRDLVERHQHRSLYITLVIDARAANALDTRGVPDGVPLALGLFRERDVRNAIDLGQRSTACARRLVLVPAGPRGALRVIEDVFNPAGGYFVTEEYDVDTWSADRLPAHAIVRVGAITTSAEGASFAPTLHLGARVDVERDGRPVEGRLHLGYVMVGDVDVFAKGDSI